MSLCGCFILEKGIIFSKSVRGTSKKLKNTQCFRFAICYCGIFRKSGMSDMWYFRSDDKVPRQSPIGLQKQNFRIFFLLNFTKEGRFFHVGIFNGLPKFFWQIIALLPHCVRDFKAKQIWKKYTHLLTVVDHCTSYKSCVINTSQTCLKRKAK